MITARGQHVGGATVLWSDAIDELGTLSDRAKAKVEARWAKDGSEINTMTRRSNRLAAVDLASVPWAIDPHSRRRSSTERRDTRHEVYLETWLTAEEDTAPIDRFFARHFPLLQRNPLTESEQFTFVKRTDPQRLPRLDTGVGGSS